MPLNDIKTILVVPQFHYDVAYLQTEAAYYPRCFDNLREAIALMDAAPNYRYMVEQPFLLEQFAAQCPEDFARLKACHARGQLEIGGALYVIPDMNMPCGESLLRQILFGKRWVRENFGDDIRTAWIADAWGHPPTLPEIMQHGGVDVYFFTRGMRPEFGKGDFLWVGLDGTEMPAHWLPRGYANLAFPAAEALETALEVNRAEATDANLLALVQELRPYLAQDTVMLCNGGDFARPQATASAVMRQWQERGLPVRFGFLHEYADALRANRDALPRETGDFNPLFIGTQASRIALKGMNRVLENLLLTAERLYAALRLAGQSIPPPDLSMSWKTLLKNQFHDIISGTLSDAASEAARQEYSDAHEAAATWAMGQGGDTNTGLVFNPSGWERTEWITLKGWKETAPVTVPAFGWAAQPEKAIPEAKWRSCHSPTTLENEFWRIAVGMNGTLTSVVDVRSGREFVANGAAGWGDLVYRNDNGDLWLLDRSPLDGGSSASNLVEMQADDPYRRSTDPLVNDNPVCQHERTVKRWRSDREGEQKVYIEGELGFWKNTLEFETTITLRAGDPLIYFYTLLKPHGKHYRLYACFPTRWPNAQARHQIPFGAMARDDRRYAALDWCEAIGEDGYGVRLLNRGIPGNAVNNGVLSLLLFRSVAMEYKAESAGAFEEGSLQFFNYAVRPFTPTDPGHADREAERLNRPLYVTSLPGEVLPSSFGFSLTPDNVHLSAFYALDDGDYLLRVYECAGRPAEGWFALRGLSAAWESDALETRGEPVVVAGETLNFTLRPWQIRSWRVRA